MMCKYPHYKEVAILSVPTDVRASRTAPMIAARSGSGRRRSPTPTSRVPGRVRVPPRGEASFRVPGVRFPCDATRWANPRVRGVRPDRSDSMMHDLAVPSRPCDRRPAMICKHLRLQEKRPPVPAALREWRRLVAPPIHDTSHRISMALPPAEGNSDQEIGFIICCSLEALCDCTIESDGHYTPPRTACQQKSRCLRYSLALFEIYECSTTRYWRT
jgi:hypothetical protein